MRSAWSSAMQRRTALSEALATTSVLTLFFGARLVIDGTLTVGELVAFNMLAGHVAQLWLAQSGDDLLVSVLGSNDNVTIEDWFSNPGRSLAEIVTDSGWQLDGQLTQLVQAMATFSAGNPGFDPRTSGTQMPADQALQGVIAAAWHTRAA
jgi:hypothetical protein